MGPADPGGMEPSPDQLPISDSDQEAEAKLGPPEAVAEGCSDVDLLPLPPTPDPPQPMEAWWQLRSMR